MKCSIINCDKDQLGLDEQSPLCMEHRCELDLLLMKNIEMKLIYKQIKPLYKKLRFYEMKRRIIEQKLMIIWNGTVDKKERPNTLCCEIINCQNKYYDDIQQPFNHLDLCKKHYKQWTRYLNKNKRYKKWQNKIEQIMVPIKELEQKHKIIINKLIQQFIRRKNVIIRM